MKISKISSERVSNTNKKNKDLKSKQKVEKIIKVGVPLVIGLATTSTVLYSLIKGKTHGEGAKRIVDATNDVISEFVDNSSEVFGGLTQSALDNLAKETPRGVKTTVQGDSLEYTYKSASGRTTNSARFKLGENNDLIGNLGNNSQFSANSPRFFAEKLAEELHKLTK